MPGRPLRLTLSRRSCLAGHHRAPGRSATLRPSSSPPRPTWRTPPSTWPGRATPRRSNGQREGRSPVLPDGSLDPQFVEEVVQRQPEAATVLTAEQASLPADQRLSVGEASALGVTTERIIPPRQVRQGFARAVKAVGAEGDLGPALQERARGRCPSTSSARRPSRPRPWSGRCRAQGWRTSWAANWWRRSARAWSRIRGSPPSSSARDAWPACASGTAPPATPRPPTASSRGSSAWALRPRSLCARSPGPPSLAHATSTRSVPTGRARQRAWKHLEPMNPRGLPPNPGRRNRTPHNRHRLGTALRLLQISLLRSLCHSTLLARAALRAIRTQHRGPQFIPRWYLPGPYRTRAYAAQRGGVRPGACSGGCAPGARRRPGRPGRRPSTSFPTPP